jgi:hypothetical protein
VTAHRKHPYRRVLEAQLTNDHMGRWWYLILECGHEEVRRITYRMVRKEVGWGGARKVAVRNIGDRRPAPVRVMCESCGESV